MITVVTPTIPGREAFLDEAKASVAAQTFPAAAHLIEFDADYAGPGPTMNKLIPRVETEWVSILADDDLYDPDHLETLIAHSEDADIVLSWSRFLGSNRPQYRGDFDVEMLRNRRDTGMRGCFLFRKSLYDEVGGWPNAMGEDWQFLINAADHGARFVPIYRETWTYRQHPGSTSSVLNSLRAGVMPENLFHLGRLILANL